MSVLMRHQPRGLTREKYDEVSRRMEEAGTWPPDGLDIHVCFGSEGDLRVSEIWDSEEQFRAFAEHLFPVLNEVGVEIGGEPELFEVQELQRRQLEAAGLREQAMSREDVEVVRRLFEATTRRDADAARPLLDPDVEWDMSAFPFPDLSGIYRGHDEVFAQWLGWFEAWAESSFEMVDVAEAGDDLVVVTRAWGMGRDGIELDRSFANLMVVRDGKLIRNRAFPNTEQALEAAGLTEQAMSRENVEIIRTLYEGFARTLPGALSGAEIEPSVRGLLDERIEWRGPREFPDLAEPHHGHEGVRRYMEKLSEAIEDYRMVPEEFIDAGDDQVLVFSREGGRGRASGAEVFTHPTAHLWTIRNGKAVRMQSYWERPDALEAAGLSEQAMSRENVEVVRQIYESWTRGDFRGGVEAFDPDIEFEMDASVTMSGPVKVRGLAEMGAEWRENLSGWGDFRVGEINRLVETEDGVIAFNRLQGRGRRSGIVVDQPDRAAIFTFRNGRIVRLRLTTATEALEAAGLSE